MPSENRIAQILELLAPAREAHLSAIRLAADEMQSYLAVCQEGADEIGARAAGELGSFAAGRINIQKFATTFYSTQAAPPEAIAAAEKALAVLREVEQLGDDLFSIAIEPGAELRHSIDTAFARIGRAFGAARVFDLVRTRRYDAEAHDHLLERFPFHAWNRAERRLAPPLVVSVDGSALSAASLADYLDGSTRLILVVRGPAAPAPLARLITPGTFVAQISSPADLTKAIDSTAPAIAAIMPEGSALFTHNPAGGREMSDRLVVHHRPTREPRRAIGRNSAAQQADELRLLDMLAAPEPVPAKAAASSRTSAETPAAAPAPPADPADRLANWLLQQV
jgi:hypothetical protein